MPVSLRATVPNSGAGALCLRFVLSVAAEHHGNKDAHGAEGDDYATHQHVIRCGSTWLAAFVRATMSGM